MCPFDRERYFQLMDQRPELFRGGGELTIISDAEEIEAYVRAGGRQIGIAYESPYSLIAVDLVEDRSGNRFAYERLIPAETGAIVSVPVYDGRFVLLRQYRHALRDYQLAFPRGFGEAGLTSRENLEKEIAEELGASVSSAEYLGKIAPDSGITGSLADVYSCRITRPVLKPGYEGIRKLCLLSPVELRECIAQGEITDGFTLAAFALYSV